MSTNSFPRSQQEAFKLTDAILFKRLKRKTQAFSREDLLVLIGVLALLAVITLPALANTKPHSQRITCVNNLRLIGQAYQMWADSHNDNNPWFAPSFEGGLGPPSIHPLAGNLWFQFYWVSNELVTPKILACPSDTTRVATDFSNSANGGFINTGYRDRAASYFLAHPTPDTPQGILSGDRNIRVTAGGGLCPYFGQGVAVLSRPITPNVGWTNSIHINTGNLLLLDGQVEQTSRSGFQRAVARSIFEDNAAVHLLIP